MDVETEETVESPSEVGWVAAQQATQPCNELGRRHSYKGGDVCLKCGMPKPVHVPRTRIVSDGVPAERVPRGTAPVVKQFTGMLSMAWMALGIGVSTQDRVRPDITGPVGRVLQFQAPVAGPRIKNALAKTPAWKPILAMMRHVGPWTDLAPLIGPPILVGLIAWKPAIERNVMPFLLPLMMPLVQEVEEMAEEQAALIGSIEEMQERAAKALAALGEIIGSDATNSPNGSVAS